MWDDRVDVFFQKNAWFDREVAIAWAERTWKPYVQEHHSDDDEVLVICDNLNAQRTDEFKRIMREDAKTLLWYLPPNETDALQAVDAGYGQQVKERMRMLQDLWLADDDNYDGWISGSLTARDRRVLLTHWFAEALDQVNAREETIRRYHEKVGNLMSITGEDDDKIRPEGLPSDVAYTFMEHFDRATPTGPQPEAGQDLPRQADAEEDDDPEDGKEAAFDELYEDEPTDLRSSQQQQQQSEAGENVPSACLDNWDAFEQMIVTADHIIVEADVVEKMQQLPLQSIVARRWDFGRWEVGVILQALGDDKFVVVYDCGDVYTHVLPKASYMDGLGAPVGSWVLLQKRPS
jgi:hypothetical protein